MDIDDINLHGITMLVTWELFLFKIWKLVDITEDYDWKNTALFSFLLIRSLIFLLVDISSN